MDYLQQLITRYPSLSPCKKQIEGAFTLLAYTFSEGGKVLIAGNGGSASDADHIVGELMKSFILRRKLSQEFMQALERNVKEERCSPEQREYLISHLQGALPAIALVNHSGLSTAVANDIDANAVFAQQVYGYGKAGDLFLGISTSGNSRNVICAALTARAKDLKVLSLTGEGGGALAKLSDICIAVPERETYKVQELHLPIYHTLCLMLEEHFFQ